MRRDSWSNRGARSAWTVALSITTAWSAACAASDPGVESAPTPPRVVADTSSVAAASLTQPRIALLVQRPPVVSRDVRTILDQAQRQRAADERCCADGRAIAMSVGIREPGHRDLVVATGPTIDPARSSSIVAVLVADRADASERGPATYFTFATADPPDESTTRDLLDLVDVIAAWQPRSARNGTSVVLHVGVARSDDVDALRALTEQILRAAT